MKRKKASKKKKPMTAAEAGWLGHLASIKEIDRLKKERRDEYYANPNRCPTCNDIISYENKCRKRFCNHRCAAIFNNTGRIRKTPKPIPYHNQNCLYCGILLHNSRNSKHMYCNNKCQSGHRWELKKKKLEESGEDTVPNCKNAKRYIIETKGHSCEICHQTEWYGKPIPLVIDHINGNSEDGKLTNLRVICPNCDYFTPFFGGKNRGNGRAARRLRYQQGKSY